MLINKIGANLSKVSKKVGKAVLSESADASKTKKVLEKANNFLQGEGYNPGRGAYYLLMGGFVVAPRLLKAREPDEFREILTRDVTTVATILFAMKALQSGMCSLAQKKSGITLVKDTVGKANPLKRLLGFFNPEGGITALASDDIIARYSRFQDRDSFVKTLNTLDSEGGSIAKLFNIENKKGISSLWKKNAEKPMYKAAQKIFGENFAKKTNEELINSIKNINLEKASGAREGLEELLGSSALKIKGGEVKGILNSKSNPITNYARGISANFNTISLIITAAFLGFGLSKINEIFTTKRHLDKPGTTPNKGVRPQQPQSTQILKAIKTEESDIFGDVMLTPALNKFI